MVSKSLDGSFLGCCFRKPRGFKTLLFLLPITWAAPSALQAGGSCIDNTDCNQSPNFCRPGVCDVFGQCQYAHSDAMCRVPPNGDNLFCNGVDFCNETTQACDVNPVNCQPPTPHCNENLDACVECLNSSQCTQAPRLTCNSSGSCVQCVSDQSCNDGFFCNGQETCNLGTGLCQPGSPVTCTIKRCSAGTNIGAICTTDANCPGGACVLETCQESLSGACAQCLNNSTCNDNQYCNGVETCNTTTHVCTAGTAVTCRTCNGGLVAGAPCLTNAECRVCSGGSNSGQPCTADADCPGGTCPAGGTCTGPNSFCNESNDSCVQCLANAHCNDGKFCTADSCIFNTCSNVPDPLQFCDNNIFCDGPETCNATTGACGTGTPPSCPKTCFRGLNHGNVCTSDTQCGQACNGGLNAGLSCTSSSNCPGKCIGGANAGASCNSGGDCASAVCEIGVCVAGLCRGGCSEQFDSCVQCASDVAGSTSCSNTAFCDGVETCNAQQQCQAGTNVNCTGLDDPPCGIGRCNETTDQCQRIADPSNPNGTPCDDGDECTRVDYCQNAFCVENPPATNDPYRCVRMEMRPTTTQSVVVGSTVSVDLYAVAQGCNTANQDCTATQHPINGLQAIFGWDPAVLQLKPSLSGDRNPLDPCDHANSCFVCSGVCSGGTRNGLACDNVTTLCPGGLCNPNPATYNWSSSLFPNDCGLDGINQPCSGFPANDGNVLYTALPQLTCGANPARLPCATTAGLNVTKIKFRALSRPPSGTTQISLVPCFGEHTATKVVSGVLPPTGYTSSDVTKALGPPATINILSCGSNADCVDADPCTVDTCLGGTCRHDVMTCADADACTIDSCVNGSCVNQPINCGTGNRCFQGNCYKVCQTVADCNDGIACTNEVCTAVPGDDICQYTTNDAACATGNFCSAEVCDLTQGCIFDHTCLSGNGNPCDNPASCNEANDTCGGCFAPAALGTGCRYIRVTPNASQGTTPIALLVEGDCEQNPVDCVSKYLSPRCIGGSNNGLVCTSDANCPKTCVAGTNNGNACTTDANCPGGTCRGYCEKGVLGDSPVYLTAAQWGVVQAHAGEFRPGHQYHVYAVCDFGGSPQISAASRTRTPIWGDTDGSGVVDFGDVSAVVNAFRNNYAGPITYQSTNIYGSGATICGDPQANCVGQDCINFGDVSGAVDAFRGMLFPCPAICP